MRYSIYENQFYFFLKDLFKYPDVLKIFDLQMGQNREAIRILFQKKAFLSFLANWEENNNPNFNKGNFENLLNPAQPMFRISPRRLKQYVRQ